VSAPEQNKGTWQPSKDSNRKKMKRAGLLQPNKNFGAARKEMFYHSAGRESIKKKEED